MALPLGQPSKSELLPTLLLPPLLLPLLALLPLLLPTLLLLKPLLLLTSQMATLGLTQRLRSLHTAVCQQAPPVSGQAPPVSGQAPPVSGQAPLVSGQRLRQAGSAGLWGHVPSPGAPRHGGASRPQCSGSQNLDYV